jgi:hypothetical protein
MSLFFTVAGFLGLVFIGIGAFFALFDFPVLGCLTLVVLGGLLTASSITALTSLEN